MRLWLSQCLGHYWHLVAQGQGASCPIVWRTVPQKSGPCQTPVAPPLRNPAGTPLSYWEAEVQRGRGLAQYQTGGFCELAFGFCVSVMFYLSLSSSLIHCIPNQGDCFSAIIVPSAVQVDTVGSHSSSSSSFHSSSLVETTVIVVYLAGRGNLACGKGTSVGTGRLPF